MKSLLLAIFLTIVICPGIQSTEAQQGGSNDDIVNLVKQLIDTKDRAVMDRYVSETFRGIGPTGLVFNKATLIKHWSDEANAGFKEQASNFVVYDYPGRLKVLTYKKTLTKHLGRRTISDSAWITHFFVYRDSRWQLDLAQATRIAKARH